IHNDQLINWRRWHLHIPLPCLLFPNQSNLLEEQMKSKLFKVFLNALALGEAVAEQIGVAVAPLQRRLVVCVALLSGLAVAWCGLIGFVGLLAPHLARALVGADQRRLLPLAAWLGALLLVLADTLARKLIIPAELPVGILTALLGAPLLMLLLHRAQKALGGGL
ncbi:MAG: iron ABC transporter permease, partial [Burkholderiales bacterium]|nr:iron ABC transporter permease [Burkholderiales bacterium]